VTSLTVTEHFTQDGYDWPAGCTDERWPADKHQPAAPYFREPTGMASTLPKWKCGTCADTGWVVTPRPDASIRVCLVCG
jgi:hypothetical protein